MYFFNNLPVFKETYEIRLKLPVFNDLSVLTHDGTDVANMQQMVLNVNVYYKAFFMRFNPPKQPPVLMRIFLAKKIIE